RRVEDLLDGAVQPVDLIDEQHVARLERRQDRRDVALPFERRPGHLPDRNVELTADDLRERGLAQPRRPGAPHKIQPLTPPPPSVERDPELLLDALLTDELRQGGGAQGALELLFALLVENGSHDTLVHAAFFSATLTCSSTGSDSSTSASTRSASMTDHPSS